MVIWYTFGYNDGNSRKACNHFLLPAHKMPDGHSFVLLGAWTGASMRRQPASDKPFIAHVAFSNFVCPEYNSPYNLAT